MYKENKLLKSRNISLWPDSKQGVMTKANVPYNFSFFVKCPRPVNFEVLLEGSAPGRNEKGETLKPIERMQIQAHKGRHTITVNGNGGVVKLGFIKIPLFTKIVALQVVEGVADKNYVETTSKPIKEKVTPHNI